MSNILLCRLCVAARPEYKNLYDENGHGNDVYEITLKYFDPMLLSPDHEQDSTVICVECWQHIDDFYGFQQSILQAQSNLETLTQLPEGCKQIDVQINEEDESALLGTSETSKATADNDEDEGEDDVLDTNASGDVMGDTHFSSDDDEKPLILHFTKMRKCKSKSQLKFKINAASHTQPRRGRSASKRENTAQAAKSPKSRKDKRTIDDAQSDNNVSVSASAAAESFPLSGEKKSARDKTKEFDAFIAQWKQELECATCAATVANFDQLREHFHNHHPNETCFVKCCERKFAKRFYLFEHLKLHVNPDTYKCNICGKCNSSSSNLAKHIHQRHTEEGKKRPFECEKCQKTFTNKFTLRRHSEVHESARDHICSECGKGFATEQRRKVHERMVHDVDRICDQCGKSIHGLYALRQHLLEHEGVEKRKYACDQCNAQLTSNASLKRHKEQKHHDGTTAYICSECGKMFNSQTSLLRHKKIVHIIERKYKCNICAKGFKFPKYLREHMASHTGIDLYQCAHCPKTFKVRSNMHHHRKRAHPKEWLEARISKPPINKININLVSNEIIM